MVRALASHQCGSGSNSGVDAICGLSLLLVLSVAPRGFSLGSSVFPSPQKPTFPNSNSTRNQVDEESLCGCATSKSLFIYYLFILLLQKRNHAFLLLPIALTSSKKKMIVNCSLWSWYGELLNCGDIYITLLVNIAWVRSPYQNEPHNPQQCLV